MIRRTALVVLITCVASCGQYREPTVNCFPFVAVAAGDTGCDFAPLEGSGPTEGRDA